MLPLELRSKILDEIPQFTRLNKNKTAGKNHLNSLYSKNISSDEFEKYINHYKPNKYFYYYKYDNKFIIAENYWEFGFYRTVYHHYYDDNNEITIQIRNKLNNNDHYNYDMIQYDLCTTYNIYKHLRKEYVDINKVILNYFNENLIKYRTNNEFINKIIETSYVYSNKLNINDSKRLSVLTTSLSHMLKNMDKLNYLSKEHISLYINNINNEILPEMYKYIKDLK